MWRGKRHNTIIIQLNFNKMKNGKSILKLVLVASLSFIFAMSVQAQSKTVLSAYLDIKDTLVDTNAKSAGVAVNSMITLLSSKFDELSKKLLADSKAISASSDVKVQRRHFDTFSQNMYAYLKKTGEKDGAVYKQFCPMAFNNTGAYWLAA